MELSLIELKVLNHINKKLSRKHKPVLCVKNDDVIKKFGDYIIDVLYSLSYNGYIAGKQTVTNDEGLCIVDLNGSDDWTITNKGKTYLANNKLNVSLTRKETFKRWISGFISGFLVAMFTQAFAYFLNHVL